MCCSRKAGSARIDRPARGLGRGTMAWALPVSKNSKGLRSIRSAISLREIRLDHTAGEPVSRRWRLEARDVPDQVSLEFEADGVAVEFIGWIGREAEPLPQTDA